MIYKEFNYAFIILRYETWWPIIDIINAIKAKCILFLQEDAEKEVEWLNKINNEKGCFYWFQRT